MSGPNHCRCGHPADSTAEHPCHAAQYTCRKPAKQRFYGARHVALSGAQYKVTMSETWACDECWAEYSGILKEGAP